MCIMGIRPLPREMLICSQCFSQPMMSLSTQQWRLRVRIAQTEVVSGRRRYSLQRRRVQRTSPLSAIRELQCQKAHGKCHQQVITGEASTKRPRDVSAYSFVAKVTCNTLQSVSFRSTTLQLPGIFNRVSNPHSPQKYLTVNSILSSVHRRMRLTEKHLRDKTHRSELRVNARQKEYKVFYVKPKLQTYVV